MLIGKESPGQMEHGGVSPGIEFPAQLCNSSPDTLGQALPPGAQYLSSYGVGLVCSCAGCFLFAPAAVLTTLPSALESDQ